MDALDLADKYLREIERLRASNAELLAALTTVYRRSLSIPDDSPADVIRDLRHIEATCRAALAKGANVASNETILQIAAEGLRAAIDKGAA